MALVVFEEIIGLNNIHKARIDMGIALFDEYRVAVPLSDGATALQLIDYDGLPIEFTSHLSDALWKDTIDIYNKTSVHIVKLWDSDGDFATFSLHLADLIRTCSSLHLTVFRGITITDSGQTRYVSELVSKTLGFELELKGVGRLVPIENPARIFEFLNQPGFEDLLFVAGASPNLLGTHRNGYPQAPLFYFRDKKVYIPYHKLQIASSQCCWLIKLFRDSLGRLGVTLFVHDNYYLRLKSWIDSRSPKYVEYAPKVSILKARLPKPYFIEEIKPEGVSPIDAQHLTIRARGRLTNLLTYKKLTSLVVNDSFWLDVETISQLNHLISFSMIGIKVTDFNFLTRLDNLSHLCISQLPVAGVNELGKLTQLTSLEIVDVCVPTLEFVMKLKRLTTLIVHRVENVDTTIRALEKHSALQQLTCVDPEFSDLHPLRSVTLRRLELGNTAIAHLEPLRNKYELEVLDIQGTLIHDLEPIKGLFNLRELSIDNTEISDLGPLQKLPNLRKLHVMNCPLLHLDSLKEVKSLKFLSVSIQLNDPKRMTMPWATMGQLDQLEELWLSYSNIEHLELVRPLRKLRVLRIDNTSVVSLQTLIGFDKLEVLDVRGTPINDFSPLKNLPRLRKLIIDSDQEKAIVSENLASICYNSWY